MFFSKKVAAMNEAEDEPASCVNCRQPVESQAGLIRVWLKSRAYLQMLPHTNIISSVPRNHYPLVHFFFFKFLQAPSKVPAMLLDEGADDCHWKKRPKE